MAEDAQKTGLIASGVMHLALLAVLTIGFSRAPKFDDATESIPVETISASQLNEIMQGEKDAKPAPAPAKPAPPPKPAPPHPEPPTPPQPPPRPEPPEPPKPEPPKPEPPPPEPPPRPAPPKPAPPPPEPPKRPEPPKPQAEDAPSPPQRPRPEKVEKAEETPRPPERPRPPKPEEPPKEPPKPAFKPDDIAKALAKDKPDPKPDAKAPSNPKSNFDPTAISKLIGQSKTAELSEKPAPQGLPNHQAPRMSVSLENGLNEWFRDSYKNCWSLPPSNPSGENYVFDVRVQFNPDGSLSAKPTMLNPPHDPQWRAHADSVIRSVARCNPLHIPAQYAPYFDQWRSKTIHFDPASAEG